MQKYLDEAKYGAIYFSLGSNLHSADIPKEKLEMIINTFRKLPEKILWKYEENHLPNKSDNILIQKWFPQNDLLGI